MAYWRLPLLLFGVQTYNKILGVGILEVVSIKIFQ